MTKDKIVFTVPEGFTLELLVDDADNPERQDPMWHTNGDGGATDVAKVTYKGNSAFVFSCGEMRIYDKVSDSVVKTKLAIIVAMIKLRFIVVSLFNKAIIR